MSEGVACDAVGRLLRGVAVRIALLKIDEVHPFLVPDVVGRLELLHSVVFLVAWVELRDLQGRHGVVYPAVLAGVAVVAECEIDGLSHLSLLEEGRVSLCGHLHHLVPCGMEPQLVLSRLFVGRDGDGVAGDADGCEVCVFALRIDLSERHGVALGLDGLVLRVAYEPGCVVTLELHDDAQ